MKKNDDGEREIEGLMATWGKRVSTLADPEPTFTPTQSPGDPGSLYNVTLVH